MMKEKVQKDEKRKQALEVKIEEIERKAFMEGYDYAIQLLIDGKIKNRR